MNARITLGACGGLLLASSAGLLVAGPLNPPAGTVASSYKTLNEVEPRIAINANNTPGDANSVFRITEPGSYYLTGNLDVGNGKSGIEIAADRVTIDLNGFSINGSASSLDGISTAGQPRRSIVVRNGTIRGFGDGGVDLLASVASNFTTANGHLLEDLVVAECNNGLRMDSGIVRNCAASDCTAYGIYAFGWTSGDVLIEGCVASRNLIGISVGNGIIRECVARLNPDTGIVVGNTGSIEACHSEENGWGYGGAQFQLLNSVAHNNTTGGAYANAATVIRGNRIGSKTLVADSVGLSVGNTGTHIEGNTIVRQSTAVKVLGINNIVVGNTISACPTAINAVAGNRIGPIVVGTSSQAINGNSGGGLGTTDPYANILY
ncbi:MAG: hypothetical protein SFZ23_00145 [Planctomycetota bacterium]|nr:hypothetical protein [Planctomycetota bacterium]